MEAWLVLLGASALVGALSAWYLRRAFAWVVAALLPPAVFLALLLVQEYLLPAGEGGASMWPVAFVVGGTAAAFTSCCALLLVKAVRPAKT
ncbi:MAG: hypothetical protein ACO1PB_00390 [Ramlibacter sp.]